MAAHGRLCMSCDMLQNVSIGNENAILQRRQDVRWRALPQQQRQMQKQPDGIGSSCPGADCSGSDPRTDHSTVSFT